MASVSSEPEEYFLGSVDGDGPWMATVSLNGTPVLMKKDTGAKVTVITSSLLNTLEGCTVMKSTRTLTSASSTKLQVDGVLSTPLSVGEECSVQDVCVVTNVRQALLGRPDIIGLNLLKVSPDVAEVVEQHVDCLNALGRSSFPNCSSPWADSLGIHTR